MRNFSYQLYSSRNFPPLVDTLKLLAGSVTTRSKALAGSTPPLPTRPGCSA